MNGTKTCPTCGKTYASSDRFCPLDGAVLRAPDAAGDLVGQVIAERYHILKKLGEGGMGQVYLAEHVRMGRKSAVKVMRPTMVHDADAIARFNREASNAARISHPNVAAIYDFGETSDGLIYLAMELVEGEPLTALLERQGALPPARAARIVRQAAEALAAAHEMGIVHRDLKPDNIMVARGRDGGDVVKVVDFGIAKAAAGDAQKVTRTGHIIGTPEYMSPEQLAGDAVDGRSDIYALGLVAFHLLTGSLPFPSETAQESMIMRLTDRPRTLAETRGDVAWPAELQAVMDRALERDVARRYQSAAELGRDLERVSGSLPAMATADAATQAMAAPAALPPTRVAREASAPTVPPTAVNFAREASRSGRGVRVAAGVGLVALALAGAAFTYTRGERAPAVTAHTPAELAVATRPDSTPAAEAGRTPDALSAQPLSRPLAASPAPATEGGRRRMPAREDRGAARADFLRLAQRARDGDTTAARRVAQLVPRLLPRLTTREDSTSALFEQAQAHATLGEEAESCALVDDLRARARGTRLARAVETFGSGCP